MGRPHGGVGADGLVEHVAAVAGGEVLGADGAELFALRVHPHHAKQLLRAVGDIRVVVHVVPGPQLVQFARFAGALKRLLHISAEIVCGFSVALSCRLQRRYLSLQCTKTVGHFCNIALWRRVLQRLAIWRKEVGVRFDSRIGSIGCIRCGIFFNQNLASSYVHTVRTAWNPIVLDRSS